MKDLRVANFLGDERGVALLIVTIISILLVLLGLSQTFDSMTETTISSEIENRNRAFLNTDAGYNSYKDNLRGLSLTAILTATTTVPQYINYTIPTDPTALAYFNRNPLAPLEAMNVDFDNPPTPVGTRTINGLMTPAAGVPIGTGGRYWVRITDNDNDEAPYSLANDPLTDRDGIVYLRVMGIQKVGAGQISTYGGTVKNSTTIIESILEQDKTLNLHAAFSVYGPSASPAQGGNMFAGNSFQIDGYDHPTMTLADLQSNNHSHVTGGSTAGVDALYDDTGAGDGTGIRDDLYADLSGPQMNNLEGDTTDYGGDPSLRDGTQEARADPDPDSTNIFDATYVMNFIENVKSAADTVIPNGANRSGDSFGDDNDPQITYCEGDCNVGGNGSGAGLLIVRGRLDFNAGFAFRGLMLVVGDGEFNMSGGNVGILGGLFVARTIDNGDGTWSYGAPTFTVAGNSNFYYQESGIQLGYSMLPLTQLAYREIIPELEP